VQEGTGRAGDGENGRLTLTGGGEGAIYELREGLTEGPG